MAREFKPHGIMPGASVGAPALYPEIPDDFPEDPLALYLLDDGSGTTAIDTSGNGYDATLGIGADYRPAWTPRGLDFGTGGGLRLLVLPPELRALTQTMIVFGRATRSTNYRGLAGIGSGGSTLYLDNGCQRLNSGDNQGAGLAACRPVAGDTSIALSSGSPGKFFVGGVEADYFTTAAVTFGTTTGTNNWIGNALNQTWGDAIYTLLLYDRVLSATEQMNATRRGAALLADRGVVLNGGFVAANAAFSGDSRTRGFGAGVTLQYPVVAMDGLNSPWVNFGINSATTAQLVASTGYPSIINATRGGRVRIAIIWIGGNDFALATGAVATAQGRMVTAVNALHAAGVYVIVCTEIDRGGGFGGGQNQAGYRADVVTWNTWLRAGSSGADDIADIGADSRLQNCNNLAYFNSDKVHQVDAGQGVVASIVQPVAVAAGLR